MPETLIIGLGGNAITRSGEPGTIRQQFERTAETLERLKPLFHSDCRLVITPGSGPQIGNILIRVEEGEGRVPRLSLDTCDADCQGGMGYMIQRLARELFDREGIRRGMATVITQVLVDRSDPAFANPSEPIGSFYTADEIGQLQAEKPNWVIREFGKGRFRRVLPSPRPLKILEGEAIACLLDAGVVAIACGGGGIPAGSMGPKIEAAIEFIAHGGEECITTSTEQVANAGRGEGGTHIVALWGRTNLEFSQ